MINLNFSYFQNYFHKLRELSLEVVERIGEVCNRFGHSINRIAQGVQAPERPNLQQDQADEQENGDTAGLDGFPILTRSGPAVVAARRLILTA